MADLETIATGCCSGLIQAILTRDKCNGLEYELHAAQEAMKEMLYTPYDKHHLLNFVRIIS